MSKTSTVASRGKAGSGPPPIAYLGPSLRAANALEVLPDLDLRAPVRRGDLYRDREAGGSLFVIIDGVFLQQQAISPREVIDVIADGALVVGASSMGALRAAECWPGGMRGIGSIYRLFRSGSLTSDDEVILTFETGGAYEAITVPLINVRHALSRAVRSGLLDRPRAETIVHSAERLFYTERTWPTILSAAGERDSGDELLQLLASHDLKRNDALRALRAVAAWRCSDPSIVDRPRRDDRPFVTSEETRERAHDASAGEDLATIKQGLVDWLLVSGRFQRYLLGVLAANPDLGLAERIAAAGTPGDLLASVLRSRPDSHLASAARLRIALFQVWRELSEGKDDFVAALWAELSLSAELDAEIFRWRAVRAAPDEARRRGWQPEARHRFLAETEIAFAHGYSSWAAFEEAIRAASLETSAFFTYRDRLATAKRLREGLFSSTRPAPTLDRSP